MPSAASAPAAAPVPSPEYLIDDILPSRELHLIAGPSGAGKTSWLLRMLNAFQKGEKVFTYATHPVPLLYVSLDRSRKSVERTLKRLAVAPDSLAYAVPAYGRGLPLILDDARATGAKLIILDGLASKVPQGRVNDYGVVSAFLRYLGDYADLYDITLIGVVHSAKTKEGEGYSNPRQRVLGSVAWAAFTETIIGIEPAKPDSPEDSTRTLMILPRNAPEECYQMEFTSGLLVPAADPDLAEFLIANFLKNLGNVLEFSTEQLAKATKLSRSTLWRQLKRLETDGVILKLARGQYRKRPLT